MPGWKGITFYISGMFLPAHLFARCFCRSRIGWTQESGPSSYRFAPVRRLGLSSQEGLPLEVLGMLSRGQPSGTANQVYMRPHPLDRNATIAQLVADRHRFTPQSCIDGDRIILHLGMLAFE
jgi:hypothetical protein